MTAPPRSNYCAILRVCSWQEDLLPPPQEPQGWARGEAWDLEGHPEPRWGRGRDPGQRQCVGQGVPSAPPRRSLNRTLRPTQAKARSVPPPPPLCLRSLRILHPDPPPHHPTHHVQPCLPQLVPSHAWSSTWSLVTDRWPLIPYAGTLQSENMPGKRGHC